MTFFWAFDRHTLVVSCCRILWLLSKRDHINSNIPQTQKVAWLWNTALLLHTTTTSCITDWQPGSSITGWVYSVSFQIENDSMATPMKEEASQSWIAAGGALLCFFYSCPDSQLLFWKDLLSLLLSCRQPFVLAFESMLDSSIVSWCRYGCMSLSKRHWQIRKRYCARQKMRLPHTILLCSTMDYYKLPTTSHIMLLLLCCIHLDTSLLVLNTVL